MIAARPTGTSAHLPVREPDRRADLEAGPPCRRRAAGDPGGSSSAFSATTAASGARAGFRSTLDDLGARHTRIRAGRPQTNDAVESLHRTILEVCWRPAFALPALRFTGLKCDLDRYLDYYDFARAHTGRLTRGRIPTEIVYGARKVKAR